MTTVTVRTRKHLFDLEIISTRTVNTNLNNYLAALLALTAVTILTVNLFLIRIISKSGWTFVNLLVVVDCVISLGHLLILLEYVL